MKILYVRYGLQKNKQSGGSLIVDRNLRVLQNIYGSEQVLCYSRIGVCNQITSIAVVNSAFRFINRFSYYLENLCSQNVHEILQLIEQEKIALVFIGTSSHGLLAQIIKQRFPKVIVITFFHNVEKLYHRQLREYEGLKKVFNERAAEYNEQCACRYSDYIIAINERDSKQLQAIYGRVADCLMPVSFEDCVSTKALQVGAHSMAAEPRLLFLGSGFFANKAGVMHFIETILPKTNATLQIVGYGTEKWQKVFPQSDRVQYCGYVEDALPCYLLADAVVASIYCGSGMKVKIAEALMYGKHIIATPEAVVGYEAAIACGAVESLTTDAAMIAAINALPQKNSSYNALARNCYLNNYTDAAVQIEFAKLIQKVANR